MLDSEIGPCQRIPSGSATPFTPASGGRSADDSTIPDPWRVVFQRWRVRFGWSAEFRVDGLPHGCAFSVGILDNA